MVGSEFVRVLLPCPNTGSGLWIPGRARDEMASAKRSSARPKAELVMHAYLSCSGAGRRAGCCQCRQDSGCAIWGVREMCD